MLQAQLQFASPTRPRRRQVTVRGEPGDLWVSVHLSFWERSAGRPGEGRHDSRRLGYRGRGWCGCSLTGSVSRAVPHPAGVPATLSR